MNARDHFLMPAHGTHHRGQITAAITAMGHASLELDLLVPVLAAQTKANGPQT